MVRDGRYCVEACSAGLVACDECCIEPMSSEAFCGENMHFGGYVNCVKGSCVRDNVQSALCVDGEFQEDICVKGFISCNGHFETGCEANVQSDASYCGRCCNNCSSLDNVATSTCSAGLCEVLSSKHDLAD